MTQNHGQRLLPCTIDQIAGKDPQRAWGSIQPPGSIEFLDISISVFANAINRVAHWIVKTVGDPSTTGRKPTLAYVGASDLRYYVMIVAIVKAGYVPLLASHLNSKAANISLFEETGCRSLLNGFADGPKVAFDLQTVKIFDVLSPEDVWDPSPAAVFPFDKTFDDLSSEPFLILHTSGSSGMPKPITYTHGSFAASDLRQDLPNFEGFIPEPVFRCQSLRSLIGLPPFHGAGCVTGLQDSIWFERIIVFPPPDRVLDAKCVASIIDCGAIGGAVLLPHVVEDLARTPEALEKLKQLNYVAWVGGPISQRTGDLIAAQTTLINAYGSTELGSSNILIQTDPTMWPWYFFHPKANSFDFRPVPGQPDLYELFVVRDPSLAQVVFRIFPHLQEWSMKDLFVPHPTLPHRWRLEGRSDDLIVLQSGSKINPRTVEAAAKQAPGVGDVVMFGARRTRPGLLIEPLDSSGLDNSERTDFLDAVFTFVEASNRIAVETSIVLRELILLTKKSKPLPKAGKNTVQRGAALELYKGEIDELYKALPSSFKQVTDFRIGADMR